MDKAVELIVSWIQKNLRNPKFYAALAVMVIIVILIFPYIDANFFFFNRIEKRVEILQSLSEIDMEKVSRLPVLQKEYDSILSEIEKQREWSISGVIASEQSSTASNNSLFKFLSGGSFAWIIALCVPFMNTFKDKKTKVFGFLLLILLGGFLGGIGYIIPTISNPWVNYIGFPILQLIALIALAVKPKNA